MKMRICQVYISQQVARKLAPCDMAFRARGATSTDGNFSSKTHGISKKGTNKNQRALTYL